MEYDGYTRILYWSKEDACFIVSVPELPGCIADGTTEIEALEKVKVIIQEWIDTARLDGRAIPSPGTSLINSLS